MRKQEEAPWKASSFSWEVGVGVWNKIEKNKKQNKKTHKTKREREREWKT